MVDKAAVIEVYCACHGVLSVSYVIFRVYESRCIFVYLYSGLHKAVIVALGHVVNELFIGNTRHYYADVYSAQRGVFYAHAQVVVYDQIGSGHVDVRYRAVEHILDYAFSDTSAIERHRSVAEGYDVS